MNLAPTSSVAAECVGSRPESHFSVSKTTGDGIDGARLSVLRGRWVPPETAARLAARGSVVSMVVPRPLDGLVQVLVRVPDNGRMFESRDAASRFCLERGYTREYFTSPDLRASRLERAVEKGATA